MMKSFGKIALMVAFLACGSMAMAQLPNEKFGKPSDMEWEYVGWKEALGADAIVLCKTMTVSYELSDGFGSMVNGDADLNSDNMQILGTNGVNIEGAITIYEVCLRTKILKPEGAKHANIDIVYQDGVEIKDDNIDELLDLKVRVFSKNEKGKVVKKNVSSSNFVKERLDDNYSVMHVNVPDVQADNIIEYTYKIRSPRPAYIYDWTYRECIPVVRSKCDLNIPFQLQFNMHAPIDGHIKSTVVEGRLTYNQNRSDLMQAKTVRTNHYTITGNCILPTDNVAAFTSEMKGIDTLPDPLPTGATHLKIKE